MRGPLRSCDVLLLNIWEALFFVKIIEQYDCELCSFLYIYYVCFNKKFTEEKSNNYFRQITYQKKLR